MANSDKHAQHSTRYSRQISLPAIGAAGQTRLAQARVLVVGAGGLGNPAALYLASAGVGHLAISDFDTVDESNLPRQIMFRDTDAGKPKAEILARRLIDVNPALTAIGISRRLDQTALASEVDRVDAVLDCCDNFRSRWLLNDVCLAARKPLISGAAIRFEGQVAVFRFDQKRTPCYRCLYTEADENLLDCAGQGILAPVAGTVGSLMATETIKLLTGISSDLSGKVWLYDGMAGNSRLVAIRQNTACPACGNDAQATLSS